MYFGLKKFISQFLMPMPLVCECFILGLILFRFTQYKKTGRFFTLLSVLLFLLFSYGFGRTYLYNLERRYPTFEPTPEQCEALRGSPIVVLGQGMPKTSDLPFRYQNNEVFERRLLEGIRVAKLIPESRLIVSMAGEATNTAKQLFLDEYMALVNFPTNRVFMFTTARDTSEEAKLAKLLIRGQRSEDRDQKSEVRDQQMLRCADALPLTSDLRLPTSVLPTNSLLLVTSGSHIPRALKIFQKAGMGPIPVPCDYTSVEKPENEWREWYLPPLPNGRRFDESERAAHEWLGNLYESLF